MSGRPSAPGRIHWWRCLDDDERPRLFDHMVGGVELIVVFTLSTAAGDLDLLGKIGGGDTYELLLAHTRPLERFGIPCGCLDLETLIRVKRAAGRPIDFEAIAELEALREGRERRDT